MKLFVSLVVLFLAGVVSARSVQDLESDLLQAIRDMIENPRQTEDNSADLVHDVTMKVAYKGKVSTERVHFDDDTGSETIEVSAGADTGEINIRHCFKEGQSLECLPESGKCYLLSMASEGEKGLQEQEQEMTKFLEESPSGEVNADDAPVETFNWVVKEEVSRADLPACLADFQPDLPVFSAEKAPEDEGTVTDDGEGAGLTEEGKRGYGGSRCAYGRWPIKKRVQKQGNCCYNPCYRKWICSTFCVECMCCPEAHSASQCWSCRHY